MTTADPAAQALRFIVQCIDTVPHLEALLLFWQSHPAVWTHEQLAARIYVTPAIAVRIVEDFLKQTMVRAVSPDAYQFNPEWDAQRQLMAQVAELYRTQLTRVATLIHSKASPVHEFARAFKLKNDL